MQPLITIVQISTWACALFFIVFAVLVIRAALKRYLRGKSTYVDLYHDAGKQQLRLR